MNPFCQAIRGLKSDAALREAIETDLGDDLVFRLIGAGRAALTHEVRMMRSLPVDLISPGYAIMGEEESCGITLVGMNAGRVVSQITISMIDMGTGTWPSEHRIWVESIFVCASLRCQGLGRETAQAGGKVLCRILDLAQVQDPEACDHFDPHPDGDWTDLSRKLCRRIADVTVPHADALQKAVLESGLIMADGFA